MDPTAVALMQSLPDEQRQRVVHRRTATTPAGRVDGGPLERLPHALRSHAVGAGDCTEDRDGRVRNCRIKAAKSRIAVGPAAVLSTWSVAHASAQLDEVASWRLTEQYEARLQFAAEFAEPTSGFVGSDRTPWCTRTSGSKTITG